MPELPEVETIVRLLRGENGGTPSLLGRSIRKVSLFWQRTLQTPSSPDALEALAGQRVEQIYRRGKFVVFHLTGASLLFHLRMSGDLRVEDASTGLQQHDRLAIWFESSLRLVFNDPRKFGRVWVVQDPQVVLEKLGPEPLGEMSPHQFYQRLHQRRRQLKPLLMDQSFLAGLGNIYTDEALFRARLHPLRLSDTLTEVEAALLLKAIRAVLEEGIRRNGASIDWVYRGGEFQNTFCVYQRTGQPCRVCGEPIQRIVVGQRGTHFCVSCQKA